MRRKLGVICVGLGVFMLLVAALLRFYAYPELAVVPLDQNASSAEGAEDPPSVSDGPDATIFSVAELAAGNDPVITTDLTSTRNTVGQVADSEELSDAMGEDLAIYETFSYTTDGQDRVLSGTFDRVIFDRTTGETIDCRAKYAELCDEKTGSAIDPGRLTAMMKESGEEDLTKLFGDEADITYRSPGEDGFDGFEGQYFKMPFNTQKQDYPWWDGSIGKATDMKYEGEESVEGLTTYKFVQTIEPTKIAELELPASATGLEGAVLADRMYANTRTVWIEPQTGVIINAQEQQLTTFDYEGETLITATDVLIGYNDETVKHNADKYKPLATQLKLLRFWAPLLGLVLGLVLLAGGLFLMLAGGQGRRRAAH